eukprot:CAMPEP_0116039898 /NCGR_PEP_ID=MMETSP0321-20121206/23955_1 /TAXON_ID=163516 /ORGANISM="Leptocylindrus danicus var. danicus, Strain B650" /LENGTH=32 /DNA_ID= /DNA_START= /DNA_END= /DNA_ORIENTATION=
MNNLRDNDNGSFDPRNAQTLTTPYAANEKTSQ